MEKIKVNKELGNAIESALNYFDGDEEKLLNDHTVYKGKWGEKVHQPLNNLSSYELAEILIKGYEIETQWYETEDELEVENRASCLNLRCNYSSWKKYKDDGSSYRYPLFITMEGNEGDEAYMGVTIENMIAIRDYLTQKIDYLSETK